MVSYNIISIDDSRLEYKKRIRKTVTFPEVYVPATNARAVDLEEELSKRELSLPFPGQFAIGEVGIWLSMFDCWNWAVENNEILITFEDDASPKDNFNEAVSLFLSEVPEDWDFICLWVPDNQKQDYLYDVTYNDEGIPNIKGRRVKSLFDFGAKHLARTYNGYGNVASMFSPKGARFFRDRAREVGLYTPVDCFLYQEAHAGRCSGYSPKPKYATLVDYDWAPTTVHNTERYVEIYK